MQNITSYIWTLHHNQHSKSFECLHRCMRGCVLGTSQPSFEPESKARPNLLAWFSSVFIAIPFQNHHVSAYWPQKYDLWNVVWQQKSSKIFICIHFYWVLGQFFLTFETKWLLRPNIRTSCNVPDVPSVHLWMSFRHYKTEIRLDWFGLKEKEEIGNDVWLFW